MLHDLIQALQPRQHNQTKIVELIIKSLLQVDHTLLQQNKFLHAHFFILVYPHKVNTLILSEVLINFKKAIHRKIETLTSFFYLNNVLITVTFHYSSDVTSV